MQLRTPELPHHDTQRSETSAAGEVSRDTADRPGQPVLATLNRLFHDAYSARSERVWQQLKAGEPPVVVRIDDRLILHSDEEPTEYEITGERYHELKAACHVPAAVHLVLAEPGPPAQRAALLAAGLNDLDGAGAGIEAMLSSTRALLEQVRTSDREPDLREALAGYRIAARRAMEMLAREAADMEVEALDQAMRAIEARLGRQRLQKAYFVICAGHQPRYKELSKMYFRRWLLEAGWPASRVAHHTVYAEGKQSLSEALELVRTRIVDGRLSAALFDDLTSLDEDVLGNAGIEQLERRFGG